MGARFELGVATTTPSSLELLAATSTDALALLIRHASGDWGDMDGHDRRANDRALRDGTRLLSSYPAGEGKVWIITEANRSSTCLLLPSEY